MAKLDTVQTTYPGSALPGTLQSGTDGAEGSVVVAGNACTIACGGAGGYAYVETIALYDLEDSFAFQRYVLPASGNYFVAIGFVDASEDGYQLRVVNGAWSLRRAVAGNYTAEVASGTYNATDHRWISLVIAAGTFAVEVAADEGDAEHHGAFGTLASEAANTNASFDATAGRFSIYTEQSGTDDQEAVFSSLNTQPAATLDQSGYRFFADDAGEGAATPLEAENTPITLTAGDTFRLRTQIDATGDPDAISVRQRYRKIGSASGDWHVLGID